MKTHKFWLSNRWATEKTTPMLRWLGGLAFWINLPLSLLLIPGAMLLPITFPGLILLRSYFMIWRDKVELNFVRNTAIGTILFNLLLAIVFLAISEGRSWPIALGNVTVAGMAGIVYNMAKDAMYDRMKGIKDSAPVTLPETLKDDYRTEKVPLEDWRIPAPKQVA